MKYCTNCNKEYENEISVCPSCGAQLTEEHAGFIDLEEGDRGNSSALPKPIHQETLPTTSSSPNTNTRSSAQKQRYQLGGRVEKLSLLSMVLLSCITCGIYGVYWITKLADIVHTLVGRSTTASGGKLILYNIITCGFYGLFFYYNMAKSLNEAKDQRSMPGKRISEGACILFMLVPFLGLVSLNWIISAVNEIIDYDNLNEMIR